MKTLFKQIKLLFLFLLLQFSIGLIIPVQGAFLFGQSVQDSLILSEINDGPYVFENDDSYTIKWIENGQLDSLQILNKEISGDEDFGKYGFLSEILSSPQSSEVKTDFRNVKTIALLSDIHGQFELFEKILLNNSIIDNEGNWSFGEGHLVIVGDVFDRGPTVTETLWLILKLEIQAAKAGGAVHYTLGNHDIMIFNRDLRYVHEKYNFTCELMGMDYSALYGKNTLIGKWLRKKPVAMSINNILINHAGISEKIVEHKLSLKDINKLFRERIFDRTKETIREDSLATLLYRSSGPIWFRGYFKDENFTGKDLDRILDFYNKNTIFVGHSTKKEILSFFEGKLYVVDSGIKYGKTGEILFWQNGKFWKADQNGEILSINKGSR